MGLHGRSQLRQAGIAFCPIDYNRIDGCQEAISLSVSFPNYRMFYSKREFFWKSGGVNWSQWVVLILEAKLLWELNCFFCRQNAAHDSVRKVPLSTRRSPLEFESLFNDFEGVSRLDLGIPRSYTTNPQAEVLVFDQIPVSYLRELHFYNFNAWEHWPYRAFTAKKAQVFYGDSYFRERKDYKEWQ